MAEDQPPSAEEQPDSAEPSSAESAIHGAEEADSERRRLFRSSTDKVVAGVAGGIGAYFGIDSVIVRIAFIVVTFMGGAGPFLYLIGWLALPREDSGSVVTEALASDSPRRVRSLLAIGLIVLGLLITASLSGALFDLFVDVWSMAPYLPLILIAAGVALVLWPGSSERPQPTPVRPRTAPASAPSAPMPSSAYSASAPPPPASAGPEWASSTVHGPSRVPSAAPRRARSTTGVLTIAVLFVYAGGAVLLARLDAVDVDVAAFFAVALAITGAGLVVSAFARPARGLLAVGLLLLPGAVLFAGADVSWWSGVGERRVAPVSAAELEGEYKHGIGRLVLDFSGLEPDGADRSLDVSLGVGEVLVYVPDDFRLRAGIKLGVGSVTKRRSVSISDESGVYSWQSLGSIDSGFGVDTVVMSAATGGWPGGALNFDIDVGAGAVDIVKVPSTSG